MGFFAIVISTLTGSTHRPGTWPRRWFPGLSRNRTR